MHDNIWIFAVGLAAAGNAIDLFSVLFQICIDIDRLEHRLVDDVLVFDGQFQKDGQAFVGHALVLAGAADGDVVISLVPILR